MIKILTLIFALIVSSCAAKKEEKSAEISYIKAYQKLEDKNYNEAAQEFEKIIDDYPFSQWGVEGQIMAVYALYKDNNYIKLVENVDNFILLNPNHSNVDYLLYMKAIAHYNQIPNIYRAQDITQQSYNIFVELIARFPESKYSKDAKGKLNFTIEHIVGGMMNKARFQMKQDNYIGAINNLLNVVQNYQQSNQIPEAYYRIAEIYTKLGIKNKAQNYVKKLQAEHENSLWFELGKKLNIQPNA